MTIIYYKTLLFFIFTILQRCSAKIPQRKLGSVQSGLQHTYTEITYDEESPSQIIDVYYESDPPRAFENAKLEIKLDIENTDSDLKPTEDSTTTTSTAATNNFNGQQGRVYYQHYQIDNKTVARGVKRHHRKLQRLSTTSSSTTTTTTRRQGSIYYQHYRVDNETVVLGVRRHNRRLQETYVINLNSKNFDTNLNKDNNLIWFVEFYAVWCPHCQKLQPKWDFLAKRVSKYSNIKIAKVDAEKETALAARYNISGYPTILLFTNGTKLSPKPYNGPRETSPMYDYLKPYFVQVVKTEQLLNDNQFKSSCGSKTCILSFLPPISDSSAKERNTYLQEYGKVASNLEYFPVTFFWLEGTVNSELEEALHLQFGYPAVIAINLDKQKYVVYRGLFKEKDLHRFVLNLKFGQGDVYSLPAELPALKTTKEWNGKDAKIKLDSSDSESLDTQNPEEL